MARLTQWNSTLFAALVADQIITPVTEAVLDEAKRTCPVRTGDLRDSLTYQVDVQGQKITGVVYTDAEYAPYVHEGRGPVEAAPGKVLGPLPAPYPRFVRRVGPARAQPWLLEALSAARAWLN